MPIQPLRRAWRAWIRPPATVSRAPPSGPGWRRSLEPESAGETPADDQEDHPAGRDDGRVQAPELERRQALVEPADPTGDQAAEEGRQHGDAHQRGADL